MSKSLKVKISLTVEVPKELYKDTDWTDSQVRVFLKEGFESYGTETVLSSLYSTINDDSGDE